MKVIDVYRQYFEAEATYNDVARHAALVTLTATSDNGTIKYEAGVSFFPHNDPTDFSVSYDAYLSKELYSGNGRRSKKREAILLETFRAEADELSETINGKIFWERPLREAAFG